MTHDDDDFDVRVEMTYEVGVDDSRLGTAFVTWVLRPLERLVDGVRAEVPWKYQEVCIMTWTPSKHRKGSKERLFIRTQTHNLPIFGVIPFVKLQNETFYKTFLFQSFDTVMTSENNKRSIYWLEHRYDLWQQQEVYIMTWTPLWSLTTTRGLYNDLNTVMISENNKRSI